MEITKMDSVMFFILSVILCFQVSKAEDRTGEIYPQYAPTAPVGNIPGAVFPSDTFGNNAYNRQTVTDGQTGGFVNTGSAMVLTQPGGFRQNGEGLADGNRFNNAQAGILNSGVARPLSTGIKQGIASRVWTSEGIRPQSEPREYLSNGGPGGYKINYNSPASTQETGGVGKFQDFNSDGGSLNPELFKQAASVLTGLGQNRERTNAGLLRNSGQVANRYVVPQRYRYSGITVTSQPQQTGGIVKENVGRNFETVRNMRPPYGDIPIAQKALMNSRRTGNFEPEPYFMNTDNPSMGKRVVGTVEQPATSQLAPVGLETGFPASPSGMRGDANRFSGSPMTASISGDGALPSSILKFRNFSNRGRVLPQAETVRNSQPGATANTFNGRNTEAATATGTQTGRRPQVGGWGRPLPDSILKFRSYLNMEIPSTITQPAFNDGRQPNTFIKTLRSRTGFSPDTNTRTGGNLSSTVTSMDIGRRKTKLTPNNEILSATLTVNGALTDTSVAETVPVTTQAPGADLSTTAMPKNKPEHRGRVKEQNRRQKVKGGSSGANSEAVKQKETNQDKAYIATIETGKSDQYTTDETLDLSEFRRILTENGKSADKADQLKDMDFYD